MNECGSIVLGGGKKKLFAVLLPLASFQPLELRIVENDASSPDYSDYNAAI